MRRAPKLLALALTFLAIPFLVDAQTPPQPKCDGFTDDTAALQSAINSAAAQHRPLVLPPGTCLTSTTPITLPDSLSLLGAGKASTIIRRKDNTNSRSDMFTLAGATGAVTISDLTLDYNRSHQNTGLNTIGSKATTVSGFTLQRVRVINSWLRAVGILYGPGKMLSNITIADCDFLNNGLSDSQDADAASGDIFIAPVKGLQLLNNHAENTVGTFFLTSTGGNPGGMGDFTITGNVLINVQGFGIALGGGGPGMAGGSKVTIRSNTFNMPTSRQNVIDVAYWDTVLIDGNNIVSGSCASGCAAIGDAPPGSKITVTNNTIAGNPALPSNNCINLGGNDEIITGNSCSDSGGSGIVLVGQPHGTANSLIANNTVKNCNKAAKGNHAGIDLFLPAGWSIANVTIRDNRVYDDQGKHGTQTFGIALEVNGSNTQGFSNITIENNDLRNNSKAAILNNARGSTNVDIHDNVGYH